MMIGTSGTPAAIARRKAPFLKGAHGAAMAAGPLRCHREREATAQCLQSRLEVGDRAGAASAVHECHARQREGGPEDQVSADFPLRNGCEASA